MGYFNVDYMGFAASFVIGSEKNILYRYNFKEIKYLCPAMWQKVLASVGSTLL
jgi:hypothetical protein